MSPGQRGTAAEIGAEYQRQKARNLDLDLTRGKPAADQLDLSAPLEAQLQGQYLSVTGADARNYGQPRGLQEARSLGAEILSVDAAEVFAFGSASLTLMYQCADLALRFGLWSDERRWNQQAKPKVLTPAPGYDRHFAICERLGLEMLPVPMTATGPDLDKAKALVQQDASIKAIWCVPRYSNPTGCVYSDQVVEEIAQLPATAAADDFVVFWDNAYAVHHLIADPPKLKSIQQAANNAGTADHILQFASTSKITYASAGLAFLASTEIVLQSVEKHFAIFAIGPDKLNQLRHARFLHGRLADHMGQHAALLRPKFELVEQSLRQGLKGWPVATWTQPQGGYFVSVNTEPGLARRVIELAAAAGLRLTQAGATFPYGLDPADSNIRIAPSYADSKELRSAMSLFVTCLKLAHIERNESPLNQSNEKPQ